MIARRAGEKLPILLSLIPAILIAYYVLGKATRDALFVAKVGLAQLPLASVAAAVLSFATLAAVSGFTLRLGPARFLLRLFVINGLVLVAEWALWFHDPRLASIAAYLHLAVSGPLLVSGFWSWLNEGIEPREGKGTVGRLVAMGTLGGVIGGAMGFALGWTGHPTSALLVLAAMSFACALYFASHERPDPGAAEVALSSSGIPFADFLKGYSLVTREGYLRSIAILVVLTTAGAQLLDLAWNTAVVHHLLSAESTGANLATRGALEAALEHKLLGILAAFNAASAVVTFAVQSTLTPRLLWALKPGGAIIGLPAVVCVFGSIALAAQGVVTIAIARASEMVVARSLFRSAYELLFVPVQFEQRRASRAIIDVGAQRSGDALGAMVAAALFAIAGFAVVAPASPRPPVLGWLVVTATVFAVAALIVAVWVRIGYLRELGKSLVSSSPGPTPFPGITETIDSFVPGSPLPASGPNEGEAYSLPPDQFVVISRDLMSGDPDRGVRALRSMPELDLRLTPMVISMLGHGILASHAAAALQSVGNRITGSLVDRLLDPLENVAVRGRIPMILSEVDDDRSLDGLLRGLAANRFHVRRRCGTALLRLRERRGGLPIYQDKLLKIARDEIKRERDVWQMHRAIAALDAAKAPPAHGHLHESAAYLGRRFQRSLAHVFTLIDLAYPQAKVGYAYEALGSDDPLRRGVALELFDIVLPRWLHKEVWVHLGDDRPDKIPARTLEEILDELERLKRAHESIGHDINQLDPKPRNR